MTDRAKSLPELPIRDEHFSVSIDCNATSPYPERAIWSGQHICVAEWISPKSLIPQDPGKAIIKHQLSVEHFSVLRHAFIKLDCAGFPHSLIAQITRHQDSAFLVQSNRYTGNRFIRVANGDLPIDEVFYFRPAGKYATREGFYSRDEEMNFACRRQALRACELYKQFIESGVPYEDARGIIPYDFRQNFTMSCDGQALFHWLDQRSKKDSQLEIQTFAALVMHQVLLWMPTIGNWYLENRYGKARLAP